MKKHSILLAIAALSTGIVACGPSEKEREETQTEAEQQVDDIIRDLENSAEENGSEEINSVVDTLPADTAGAQNKTYTESHE